MNAAPALLWVLRRIVDDLPAKRDWLDPDLERAAREAIAHADRASVTLAESDRHATAHLQRQDPDALRVDPDEPAF